MENFIVSARKYRPVTFDTVVGQKSITVTLKNAIKNNQLAQAFLFCGPRGVGKTTCARILAKTINCENLSEDVEPCNTCPSCVSFSQSASFNIHELDAASNNSVDDIRSLIDQVRIPPQVGRYKVYIIDEVHMLSAQAFNAFLKTLEEPPSYAKFILATTEKHKILPTILSRCQIYDFHRITIDDIASHLAYVAQKENIQADPDALHIIAQKADGALRDALSIFDQIVSFAGENITYEAVIENLNVLDYDYYFKMVDSILQSNVADALLLFDGIISNGFDGSHFITGLAEHMRSLLVCKEPSTVGLLEAGANIREKYQQQANVCTAEFIFRALELTNYFDLNYKASNNKRLHVEIMLMQLCGLTTGQQSVQKNEAGLPLTKQKKQQEHKQSPASEASPTKPGPTPAQKNTEQQTTYKPQSHSPSIVAEIGALSIKEMAANSQKESEQPKEKNPDEPDPELPKNEFSQSQLEQAWSSLVDTYAGNSSNFYSTLKKRMPVLEGGFSVNFTVDNKVQELEMKERKVEILTFLRKRFNNFSITLDIKIEDSEEDAKPYTVDEKFKRMKEKNPDITNFKDTLDLELDY